MRFLGRSLMGLILLSLTVGLLAWAGATLVSAVEARRSKTTQERPHRERVFSVNVVKVTASDIAPVLTKYGELRSLRTLDLRAPESGRIIRLAAEFAEGGRVQEGQFLAQIDPADALSVLEQAKADLQEAQNEVQDAAAALKLATRDLELAKAQAALRKRTLSRQKDLQKRGVGTDATVEAAELADAAAAQVVLSRQQAIQKAQARVKQASIRVKRLQISLKDAQRRLSDTRIVTPFPGTLDQVSVVAGGLVAKNERLAQLIDPSELEVAFRVSTSEYARLLTDDGGVVRAPVEVVLDVLGLDLTAHGVLSRESGAVGDGLTGRQLFAQLDDARGFRPGDFVEVRLKEPTLKQVTLLPATALNAKQAVLVLGDDDRLEEVPVKLLRRQGNDVIVRAAELVGREVVAKRSPLLGAGIKVRPLRADSAARSHDDPTDTATVVLEPERRARLVSFIKNNSDLPEDARKRMLTQLEKEAVPVRVVTRIEARMGG